MLLIEVSTALDGGGGSTVHGECGQGIEKGGTGYHTHWAVMVEYGVNGRSFLKLNRDDIRPGTSLPQKI